MRFAALLFLILMLAPASGFSQCISGDSRCNGNTVEICWMGYWSPNRNCRVCTEDSGFASCEREQRAGCCVPRTLTSFLGCAHSQSGRCFPLFYGSQAKSCYEISRCVKESGESSQVVVSPVSEDRYQISVEYPKEVIVVLSNAAQRWELKTRLTGGGISLVNTPRLRDSSYKLEVFDGMTRIYSGRLDTEPPIPAQFDPNYLMSNTEFLDYRSVTQSRLQDYFESKGWWVKAYRLPSGKLLSQKIMEEALKQGINPILLLARIQTEQSAIQTKPSEKQLSRLTGCLLWDKSMQSPDRQIECAAERLRHWFDYAHPKDINGEGQQEMRLEDGRSVTPANAATFSLYKYTPYSFSTSRWGGNELHYRIYSKYRRELLSHQKI